MLLWRLRIDNPLRPYLSMYYNASCGALFARQRRWPSREPTTSGPKAQLRFTLSAICHSSIRVFVEILGCPSEALGIVIHESKCCIAGSAKEAADLSCLMIMVDRETHGLAASPSSLFSSTNSTATTLFRLQFSKHLKRYSEIPHYVLLFCFLAVTSSACVIIANCTKRVLGKPLNWLEFAAQCASSLFDMKNPAPCRSPRHSTFLEHFQDR
jgi:hypothetical protein